MLESNLPPDRTTDDDVLAILFELFKLFSRAKATESARISLQSDMPTEDSMRDFHVQFRSRGMEVQSDFGDELFHVRFNKPTGLKIFGGLNEIEPVYEVRQL